MRLLLSITFCCLSVASAAEIDFQRDVQPLFAEYCLECHGPGKAKGGLNLSHRDGFLNELKSGTRAVIPGQAASSELILRVTTTAPDEIMPPKEKAKRPTPAEIELLRQWVQSGAPWNPHWAYRPITRPPLPSGPEAHPIDRFVRAKLREEKIAPSPEADRSTLIKRVFYDLVGLTPSPAEVDAFLHDTSPDAYARLLERVLASLHFGSAGAGTGSIKLAMLTAMDTRRTARVPTPGATATG